MSMTTDEPKVASELQLLREQGWCILRDLIPPDDAKASRYALWRCAACCGVIAQAYNSNLVPIPFYTRVSVIKDANQYARYLADDRVLRIVRGALGQERVCVTATTMPVHESETPRGPWHAGEPFDTTSTSLRRDDAITHLTTVWMFTRFTTDSGGYLILPGSHLRGAPIANDMTPKPGELHITGAPGTVLITDSRLWRAIAANNGDHMRMSVVVGYAAATGAPSSWPRDAKSAVAQPVIDPIPSPARELFAHWTLPVA